MTTKDRLILKVNRLLNYELSSDPRQRAKHVADACAVLDEVVEMIMSHETKATERRSTAKWVTLLARGVEA